METKRNDFYNGIVFNNNDNNRFVLSHNGEWFDYCPCDGISPYMSNKYCLRHIRIIDYGYYFFVVSKPNYNVCDRLNDCKRFVVEQINKNQFKDSTVTENDIISMNGIILVTVICNTYNECDDIWETLKL